VAAQEAQRARSGSDQHHQETTDLSSARLLRQTPRPPQSGWRLAVYKLSGRLINPGESPSDVRRRELTARLNKPLLGCYKIAMLSLKGGVGKTTVTATLGATFASLRGDRVVAVDANPDRGTLSQKIPLETSATVRHLLRDAQRVRRYTDVRAYTSQGPSRLEVLASEQDPAVSEAFSEEDYRRTIALLEHFYNIVLTDCGTGLMHSAMYGVLGLADQLIIVSSGSIDGARSASATMDWLDAHGHGDLVRNSVAVLNSVHRSSGGVDLDRVAEHFAARCRAVVRVPYDPHLEEGAEVDLDRLAPATRLALLQLGAAVADAFEGAAV
jgi:MinD-like ATPase involved in chromosome partitioning or flagellar assembly